MRKVDVARRMKGYQSRDAGTHRTYNFQSAIKRYKKTGKFLYKKDGSGHRAGESWGEQKGIDPDSPETKYSKNSPSFDEGVYKYKQMARARKEMVATKSPYYLSKQAALN